jgi:hypothetical protein
MTLNNLNETRKINVSQDPREYLSKKVKIIQTRKTGGVTFTCLPHLLSGARAVYKEALVPYCFVISSVFSA